MADLAVRFAFEMKLPNHIRLTRRQTAKQSSDLFAILDPLRIRRHGIRRFNGRSVSRDMSQRFG